MVGSRFLIFLSLFHFYCQCPTCQLYETLDCRTPEVKYNCVYHCDYIDIATRQLTWAWKSIRPIRSSHQLSVLSIHFVRLSGVKKFWECDRCSPHQITTSRFNFHTSNYGTYTEERRPFTRLSKTSCGTRSERARRRGGQGGEGDEEKKVVENDRYSKSMMYDWKAKLFQPGHKSEVGGTCFVVHKFFKVIILCLWCLLVITDICCKVVTAATL